MPIVKRTGTDARGDTQAHVEQANGLIRLGEQLTTHELLRVPVSELSNGSAGAALFVIHQLKKLASDRYDGLRTNLIDRVKKVGRVDVDVLAGKGSASAYLDGWAVAFSLIPKWRDVRELLANPKTKRLVVQTVSLAPSERLPCPTCGGSGFCTGGASVEYEVNANAVGNALRRGEIKLEEVASLEWRLGQIVPPSGLAR